MAAVYFKTRNETTGKLNRWGKFLFIVILLGASISSFIGIRQLQDDINKHKEIVTSMHNISKCIKQLEELTKDFRLEANTQINRISIAFSKYETAYKENFYNLKKLGESQIAEVKKVSENLNNSADRIENLNTDFRIFSEKEAERFNKRIYNKIREFDIKKGKEVQIENELVVYLKEVGNGTGDVTIKIFQELYKRKKIEEFENVGIKIPMIFKYGGYEYYIVANEAKAVKSSKLNTVKLIVAKKPVIVSISTQTLCLKSDRRCSE